MFKPDEVLQACHIGNQILFKPDQSTWSQYVPPGLNIHKYHIVPTQCIYVLCVDSRTNSDYFPIQH